MAGSEQWVPKGAVPIGDMSHEEVMSKIPAPKAVAEEAWTPKGAVKVEPSWGERQLSDLVGAGQAAGAIAAGGAMSIPGALQAAGNWILTGDVEQAKAGMEQWVEKAYQPTNPLAQGVVNKLGSGFEYLAGGTEELFGPEARMLTELGLIAAPFAPSVVPKRTPLSRMRENVEQPVEAGQRRGIDSDIIDSPDVRLAKYAPELQGRVRQMEAEGFRKTVEHQEAVQPLLDTMAMIKNRDPVLYSKIQDAYLRQPTKTTAKSGAGISEVRKWLSEAVGPKRTREIVEPLEAAIRQRGIEMVDVNPKMGLIPTSYLPRRVLHPEKLGIAGHSPVAKALNNINEQVAKGEIDALTAERLRNKAITSDIETQVRATTSKHERARKIREIRESQKEAYATLEDALTRYFEETGWSIAEKKFLGKGVDTEASIGSFMEKHSGNPNAKAIHDVLKARFGPNARAGMDRGWNNLKELGYLGTIADFASAITQLGDLAGSMGRQGIIPTTKAIYQSVGNKTQRLRKGAVDPEAVGIVDVMQEMATARGGINKLLDKTLSYSGFKMIDRFGKRTLLTSAKNRLTKLAKKESPKLRKEYWWMEEGEFKRFQSNLKKGDVKNPDVQFALVNELLDVQPMSLSQMPIKYLQMRNGRIFYALKTWAIRQLNRYREDVIKGNPGKALKYAAAIYAATEGIDLSKDILTSAITGVPLEQQDVADNAINNLLRMMFLSTYSLGKVKGGDTEAGVSSMVNLMPSGVGVVGDVMLGIYETLFGEGTPDKAVKRLPIIGRSAAALMEEE